MSTLVDLEGKQLQWGIGFDSPLFVSSFLLTSVMLRHEASASSVADTSFLPLTLFLTIYISVNCILSSFAFL